MPTRTQRRSRSRYWPDARAAGTVCRARALSWVLAFALAVVFSGLARAQVQIECQLNPPRVYAGDTSVLTVNVKGSNRPKRPTVAPPPGVHAEFQGEADTSTTFRAEINGKVTERRDEGYVFQFRVSAAAAGEYVIPSPDVVVEGKSYRGNPVKFRVTEPESSDEFSLDVSVDKATLYVGEPTTMRILWTLGGNIRNHAFAPMPGIDRLELGTPRGRAPTGARQNDPSRVEFQMFDRTVVGLWRENADGRRALAIEVLIIPKSPGALELGPLSVAFDAIVGQRQRTFWDSPFDDLSKTTRVAVRSKPITLTVKPLPTEGKPPGFAGLVGPVSVSSALAGTDLRVGDPVTLTLTIDGTDPLERVRPPELDANPAFGGAFKLSPEGWTVVSPGTDGPLVLSTSVRVSSPRVTELPAIELPYFDPQRGTYAVARSAPIKLNVKASKIVTSSDAIGARPIPSGSAESTALRAGAPGLSANTESLDALTNEGLSLAAAIRSPAGVAVIAGPPMIFAAVALAARSPRADSRRALRRAARRACAAIDRAPTASEILDATYSYFGKAMQRESASLTADECRAFARGHSRAAADTARSLFTVAEADRFGHSALELADLKRRAKDAIAATLEPAPPERPARPTPGASPA